MSDPKRSKVFISYSPRDRAPVETLAEKLKAEGLDVWIDREKISPDTDWQREIETELDESSVFLFVVSPNSAASPWQQMELGMALRSNKNVIPVLLGESDLAKPPAYLQNRVAIQFDPGDGKRAVESIAKAAGDVII